MEYKFEHNGDVGELFLTTHLHTDHIIKCHKLPDESFRLGGTAIDQAQIREVIVNDKKQYAVEYYNIHMETEPPQWIIVSAVPENARLLFINVDILDGGGNIMRRYRIDPWFGNYKEMSTW